MPHRERRRSRGFTLVEIMIALSLASLVILGARLLLERVGDTAMRMARESRGADTDANGERLLRDLVLQAETDVTPRTTFHGDESGAYFTSWCRVPAGWGERCVMALTSTSVGGGRVLVVRLAGDSGVIVGRTQSIIIFRYLADAAGGGTWVRIWDEALTMPRAIGVITERDTLILRVGRQE